MIRRAILAVPLLFLAVFLCFPLSAVLHLGLLHDPVAMIKQVVRDPALHGVVWMSGWQALASTLATLLCGLPGAYVFARFRFAGRSWWRALATVPFVLPTTVVAAGFTALLGPRGAINTALVWLFGPDAPTIQVLNTFEIVILAHVFFNYSVVVRVVGNAWAALDAQLEQAAAVLGASPARVLLLVTLPLLGPSIAAAALIVFLFCFSSFGVVLLLGGPRFATVEVEIYRQTSQFLRLDIAAALALVQLATALLVGMAANQLLSRAAPMEQRVAPPVRPRSRWAYGMIVTNIALLIALIGLPLAALAVRSIMPAPGGFALTLDYYAMLDENRRGSFFFVSPFRALANSLGFAVLATLLALLVGIPAAYLVARRSARSASTRSRTVGQSVLDVLFLLPLGVSAVMLGLGFLISFGPTDLLRSPLLIPVAHALLGFPFVVRSVAPALRQLDPRWIEAARMLGAGPWQAFLRIEVPLLLPAILTGALFALTVSLGDYGAALLLARPEYPTAPLVIGRLLGQPGATNYGQALALSTLLMLMSMACFVIMERLNRNR